MTLKEYLNQCSKYTKENYYPRSISNLYTVIHQVNDELESHKKSLSKIDGVQQDLLHKSEFDASDISNELHLLRNYRRALKNNIELLDNTKRSLSLLDIENRHMDLRQKQMSRTYQTRSLALDGKQYRSDSDEKRRVQKVLSHTI